MSLVNPVFSDGIGSIAIVGGTVRVNFVVFSPDETDAEGRPKIIPLQQIVMTLDGFLRSSEKAKEAVQALSKLAHPPGAADAASPSGNGPSAVAPKRPFP